MATSVIQSGNGALKDMEEEGFLDENNPHVQKYKETLRKHLEKHKEKLEFENREMLKDLKKAKKEREELGQKLYTLQKIAEKYTKELQGLVEQSEKLESARPALENKLEMAKEKLSTIQESFQKKQNEEKSLLHEVDNLNKKVYQLEVVKESQKSDATVLMHAAKNAVVECSRLEKDKKIQEKHLERLTMDVQNRQEKIALYNVQIADVIKEAKEVRDALSQARMEIDTINLEKQALFDQWNNCIGKLQSRNETLAVLQQSFISQQVALKAGQLKVNSLGKSIIEEEAKEKKLIALSERLEKDINSLKKQLMQNQTEDESAQLELAALKRSDHEAQTALETFEKMKASKEAELKTLQKDLQAVQTAKYDLQTAINQQVLNSKWISKAGHTTLKEIQTVQDKIKQLENAKAKVLSEVSKLQAINAEKQANIQALEDNLNGIKQEAEEKEEEIKQKELNIRKNMSLIDKKQQQINQLRMKLDKLTSLSGSDIAPTELQLNNVQKELENAIIEAQNLQKTWLGNQRELVKLSQEQDKCSTETQHLHRQFNVYNQKRLHIEEEIQRTDTECYLIEKNIDNLHRVITQLNKKAYNECTLEDSLTRMTILTEDKLLHTLRDGENKLAVLTDKLQQLRDEEESLSQKLLDSESELLQWQQKFHLTKEVKSTVQSEYKEGEIHELQNNLHKMKVMYTGLRRRHGHIAQGMEKAVHRWDALLSKKEARLKADRKEKEPIVLKRQIEELKQRRKSIAKEIETVERNAVSWTQQNDELLQEIESKRLSIDRLKKVLENFKEELHVRNREKIQNFERLVTRQQQVKLYQAIRDSKYRLVCSTPEVLESQVEKHKMRSIKLKRILEELTEEFPEHASHLQIKLWQLIAHMAELGIDI